MVSVKPLTVHWHQDSAPIYSACFQPREPNTPPNRSTRLVTAGGDNNARVWRLKLGADPAESPHVEYYSTLSKHERAVNTVKFDCSGQVLASAGDDGVICIWALNEGATDHQPFGAEYEDLETWRLVRKCRTASFGEIYDLAWSPSGRYLAAASMDKVVSIIDTKDGSCTAALRDHKHYVQGVSWDPKDEFLATQSSDQRVLLYSLKHDATTKKITSIGSPIARLDKAEIDGMRISSFHPESFSSFFRRLAFSPDGSLLVVPSCQIDVPRQNTDESHDPASAEPAQTNPTSNEANGTAETNNDSSQQTQPSTPERNSGPITPASQTTAASQPSTQNCALIYTRANLRKPSAVLPLPKPSTVVQFSPILYKLRHPDSSSCAIKLPYRMVYAIATLNGVFIYDTEQMQPLGMASNLHYSAITDLCWSPDGRLLLLTSIDGFCSLFRFEKNELGEVYENAQAVTVTPAAALAGPVVDRAPVINTLMVRKKQKVDPPAPNASATNASATNESAPKESALQDSTTKGSPESGKTPNENDNITSQTTTTNTTANGASKPETGTAMHAGQATASVPSPISAGEPSAPSADAGASAAPRAAGDHQSS